jgi:hypothetical protein
VLKPANLLLLLLLLLLLGNWNWKWRIKKGKGEREFYKIKIKIQIISRKPQAYNFCGEKKFIKLNYVSSSISCELQY